MTYRFLVHASNVSVSLMNCIVLYCIAYLLSTDGHIDRVIFYVNENIKLDHVMVHLLMQRGMNWNVRL